jgi:hypothetical protein
VGFEPTNGGFADLSLGPLGYRAELLSIAKLAYHSASDRNCRRLILKSKQELARQGLKQKALSRTWKTAKTASGISYLLFLV